MTALIKDSGLVPNTPWWLITNPNSISRGLNTFTGNRYSHGAHTQVQAKTDTLENKINKF